MSDESEYVSRLRFAFDEVADAYDRGRPDFDDEIVRELTSQAGLVAGDPVLEIGAGPGSSRAA